MNPAEALGIIIPNPAIRRVLYAGVTLAAFALGVAESLGATWATTPGTIALLLMPLFGGLAIANTDPAPRGRHSTDPEA